VEKGAPDIALKSAKAAALFQIPSQALGTVTLMFSVPFVSHQGIWCVSVKPSSVRYGGTHTPCRAPPTRALKSAKAAALFQIPSQALGMWPFGYASLHCCGRVAPRIRTQEQ
jgi:hypothetical protein